MDEQLKNLLKEKTSRLKSTELLPDFHPQQSWARLSDRLDAAAPVETRRILPLPFFRYAAAALAGALIGAAALYFGLDRRPAQAPVVLTTGPAKQAPVMALPTPAPAERAAPVQPAPAASGNAFRRPSAPARALSGNEPAPPLAAADSSSKSPALAPAPVVAAADAALPAAAPRALHLLDVRTEDRSALLVPGHAAPQSGPRFTLYISPSRLPSANNATEPASIIGGMRR